MVDDGSTGTGAATGERSGGGAVAAGRTWLRAGTLGGVVAAGVLVVLFVRRYSFPGGPRATAASASGLDIPDRLLGRARGPYGTPLAAFVDERDGTEPGRRPEEDPRGERP